MRHQRTRTLANFNRFLIALTGFALLSATPAANAAGKAQHVLIVVMDGLRRDSVTETDMPTLYALSKSGTFFDRHHPVYLSTTEVNGTALATGMSPASDGIMANREYRPDIDLLRPIDTQGQWAAWKGDTTSDINWVHTPTLPELARANNLKTVVAGTKGIAMLWDRSYRSRSVDQPTLFEGKTIPSAVLDKILPDLGPLPPGVENKHFTNIAQDTWTTRALTEKLWADGVPALSILWLSEPDFSQHGTGPGSAQARQALRSSDDRLATALATLDKKGVRDQTDVLVVSDHGFSTITRKVDVGDQLRKNKFKAEGWYKIAPQKGTILHIGLGGTQSFYVIEHDKTVITRLVAFLQTTNWAGVIFTRDGAPGTFKYSDVCINTPEAPDVVVAMRWKDEIFKDHLRGTIINDGGDPGQGTHGSLSRYDMRNTLIAAGPDFKPGFVNTLPSANSDVAPTVAQILGITPPRPMDGRVLAEAMIDVTQSTESPKSFTLQAGRAVSDKSWNQYIRLSKLAGRTYYDEGNAGTPPEK